MPLFLEKPDKKNDVKVPVYRYFEYICEIK